VARKTAQDLRGAESGAQRATDVRVARSKRGEPTWPSGADDETPLPLEGSSATLPKKHTPRSKGWVALGADTSMTAISLVGMGYDRALDRMSEVSFGEIRWAPEVDYFERLRQAAKGHEVLLDVMSRLPMVNLVDVYLAIEEPIHYGVAQRGIGSYIKQQSEVAGSFKGALLRWGLTNIFEINNSQWKATLRKDGVEFQKNERGASKAEKAAVAHANKFVVKEWARQAFGLPDLPDLVKSKTGAKIPRPESGFGANARAEQPSDVFDAAACLAWMLDSLDEWGVTD